MFVKNYCQLLVINFFLLRKGTFMLVKNRKINGAFLLLITFPSFILCQKDRGKIEVWTPEHAKIKSNQIDSGTGWMPFVNKFKYYNQQTAVE